MTHYGNIGLLVVPLGFVIGNIITSPLFFAIKLQFNQTDSRSQVILKDGTFGSSSTHIYDLEDFGIITLITLCFYFG